jgi:hypothetical protein
MEMVRTVVKAGQVYKVTYNPRTVEIPIDLWNAILDDLDTIAASSTDLRIKLVNAAQGPHERKQDVQ